MFHNIFDTDSSVVTTGSECSVFSNFFAISCVTTHPGYWEHASHNATSTHTTHVPPTRATLTTPQWSPRGVVVAFAVLHPDAAGVSNDSPFPQRGLHRTIGQMKNRMLKLLLLLAAVAALAVAAPLAAPDFNDLDVSDLDASDNDASDLDASDNDASDLDASELDASELDASELDDSELNNTDPSESDLTCEVCTEADERKPCKLNEYISSHVCTRCPDKEVVPYGPSVACGKASCFPCPDPLIIDETGMCVTSKQSFMLKQLNVSPTSRATIDSIDQSDPAAMNGIVCFIAGANCSGSPCNNNATAFIVPQIQAATRTQATATRTKATATRTKATATRTKATATRTKATATRTNNLQVSSCASGTTCCLPGFYGASSASCTECPSNKPSSPYSAPNINCQCPNSGSNKCFACTNKCKPYDSQSRTCLPVQCPSGQTCKTINNAAQCVSG
jgi:hypothetical protein